jgi:L-alanine-DL-glutamate epimerase-like enolase superfamily enzyme
VTLLSDIVIENVRSSVFSVPTDAPESDGTLSWDQTTMITAEIDAGGKRGFGYTYGAYAVVDVIRAELSKIIEGQDPLAIEAVWNAMVRSVRNAGRSGIASCAISAVDIALWDLKSKLLDVPLVRLLGAARGRVAAYGSGGFTSYDDGRLARQLASWAQQGCAFVKMKVGRHPARDCSRVEAARSAIGDTELFVDANGAYGEKKALEFAKVYADSGVTWFEEPVSSDNLKGLRLLRKHSPGGLEIAAGEYGYTPFYFRRMLEEHAVDVLQADATRCGGITGFLRVAALCDAFDISLSSHCAPAIHLHAACAAPRLRHMEWFHDHVRIEQSLLDGAPVLHEGYLTPDLSRPGLGIALREADAEKFRI